MFKEIEVKRFRGIKKCENPIKLSKFNILIGPNNSGKSSILEGLFLFPPFKGHHLKVLGISRHKVLAELHSQKAFAYRYAGNAIIKYTMDGQKVSMELHPEGDVSRLTVDNKPIHEITQLSESLRGATSEQLVNELINYSLLIPNSDSFMNDLGKKEFTSWDLIEATGAHTAIVRDIISKVVEDKFTEVAQKRDELVLRKELPDGDVAYISIRDQGDGVERFILSALWLEAVKPKVVLWDDFETSAHPSLVHASLQWLAHRDWQVVLSTHSADVLKEFVEIAPKESQALTVRKKANDTLIYKAYLVDDLSDLIESRVDPRKLLSW
jgi:predicted ATPase